MKNNRIYVNLNNYVKVDTQTLLNQSTRWLCNGVDNTQFLTVEAAYIGSPTNTAIIDNFVNYLLGEGLVDVNEKVDVSSIISDEDLRNFLLDYKIQGQCSLQVIYNYGGKIAKLYYMPVKSLAANREPDITDDVTSYWYSYDWRYRATKFKPVRIPAFGYGQNNETEILYIKRHSFQPVYALPDWQSGIQYCQTEEELSNYYRNHIKNNFSAGKIVNINQGGTDSEEAMEEAERSINSKLTGSSNAGTIIVSFNDNKDNATTVETIEITDAYSQFQFLSNECRTMIMMAHKVNDPSLFGLPMPSGFSSVAEQMVQSLRIFYRSQVKPARMVVLEGLQKAFSKNDPNCKLEFLDFDELKVQQTPEQITQPTSNVNMVNQNKVSFDFDDTLTTDAGIRELEAQKRLGKEIYIISARNEKVGMIKFANDHRISLNNVYATGSNLQKVEKIRELGISKHFDNNQDVVDKLPGIGKKI